MVNCAWCGSKGGFVNRLIKYECSPYGDAVYECEWCIMLAKKATA